MSPCDLVAEIALIPEHRRFGGVTGVMGMLLDAGGLRRRLGVGGQCAGLAQDGKNEPADLASGGAPLATRLEVPR